MANPDGFLVKPVDVGVPRAGVDTLTISISINTEGDNLCFWGYWTDEVSN